MALYEMFASEFSKLKKQMEKLLENRFFRPSVSRWSVLILLVKKNDGSTRLCVDY